MLEGRDRIFQAYPRIVEKPERDTRCLSPSQAERKEMPPAGDERPVLSSPNYWGVIQHTGRTLSPCVI